MDSKLSPAQADLRQNGDPHHDGDLVLLAPKDWTDTEEALSRLAHVASDRRRPTAGCDFSPGPRVSEPSLDATFRPAQQNNEALPAERPAPGRRALRSLARFVVTACIGVAATLAWQSYGGATKQMIASSAPQLSLLLSPPATNPPSGGAIAVEPPSPAAAQASAPQAASAPAGAVAAPTASETAASPAPTAPAAELQQLATMAHDLAAVRQSVEQLAAGQEQMAGDIAKLQAAGQEIRRRVSALPPAAATVHRPLPPPQPPLQSSVAPPPPPEPAPPTSAARLPPAPQEAPLRPPLPVR
jgi:hypothetical protein